MCKNYCSIVIWKIDDWSIRPLEALTRATISLAEPIHIHAQILTLFYSGHPVVERTTNGRSNSNSGSNTDERTRGGGWASGGRGRALRLAVDVGVLESVPARGIRPSVRPQANNAAIADSSKSDGPIGELSARNPGF